MDFSFTSVTRNEKREREAKQDIKSREGMIYLKSELCTQFGRKKGLMRPQRLGMFDEKCYSGRWQITRNSEHMKDSPS